MANSGIVWIDITYDFCVLLLIEIAKMIGISYEEINVWLFVILLPLVLTVSIFLNIYLFRRLKTQT